MGVFAIWNSLLKAIVNKQFQFSQSWTSRQNSEMKSTLIVILALGLTLALVEERIAMEEKSLHIKVNKSKELLFHLHPLNFPSFISESLSKMHQCSEKIHQCKIEQSLHYEKGHEYCKISHLSNQSKIPNLYQKWSFPLGKSDPFGRL